MDFERNRSYFHGVSLGKSAMRDELSESFVDPDDLELDQDTLVISPAPWTEERRRRSDARVQILNSLCDKHRSDVEYFKSILGAVPHGLMIINKDNRLEYANQAALRICLKDETHVESFLSHHHDIQEALKQMRNGAKVRTAMLELDQGHYAVDFFPLAKNGDRVGLVLTDVTDRNRLEKQYYEEKHNLMTQLAGGIAHEIANQLFPIQGRAQLVSMMLLQANCDLNPEIFKSFKVIEEQVQRISRIVDDLRHLSRPAEPRFADLDLTGILKQVVDTLAAPAGKTKRFCQDDDEALFRLRINLHHQPLTVRGDKDQLHQALMNLMINAAHAVEDVGQGTLTVGTYAQDGKAIAYVEDTGPGIPEEVRQKIFEPYFTGKCSGRGTGLGLTIVRNIVRAHDGELALRTEAGRGTRFEIKLPLLRKGGDIQPFTANLSKLQHHAS